MELSSTSCRPSTEYEVHQCEYCPKDYAVLKWPSEDIACIAKIYNHLPEEFQCTTPVYECITPPSDDNTVYYCPWCGEEVLKDGNYEA